MRMWISSWFHILVPDFGTRGVERVNPAAPLARDPPRVVAQGGRRVRVTERGVSAVAGELLERGFDQAAPKVSDCRVIAERIHSHVDIGKGAFAHRVGG